MQDPEEMEGIIEASGIRRLVSAPADSLELAASAYGVGWGRTAIMDRQHFFVGTRSLCARWTYTGPRTDEPAPADLPACDRCKARLDNAIRAQSRLDGLTSEVKPATP